MERSLLIGCGKNHIKQIQSSGKEEWIGELTKLDMNPGCGADIVWDMEVRPLPFDDNTFDEIGAYNCMEHWGKQGDWRGWFGEMSEYHRILKPLGTMGILVPINDDSLADPGHTRFFHANYLWYWKLNFDILYLEKQEDHHLAVILRKN
jgi:SAM-dependent methyltransferase